MSASSVDALAPLRRFTAELNGLLVAPSASRAELRLGYGTALIGAVMGVAIGWLHGGDLLLVVLLGLVGFDLFGGAVVNAMTSGSARFHGRAGGRGHRLRFVALHLHLPLLAIVLPGVTWSAAVVLYAAQLVAAVLIESVPGTARRPVAFACAAVVTTVAVTLVTVPSVIAWVAPLLCIKLLLGHLVPAPGTRTA